MTLYRLDGKRLLELRPASLKDRGYEEQDLEAFIERNPWVLTKEGEIAVIARQYPSGSGVGDLLGIDSEGNIVVVELKRGKTSRDAIAQALEYSASASKLTLNDLEHMCNEHRVDEGSGGSLCELAKDLLGLPEMPSQKDLEDTGMFSGRHHRTILVGEVISPGVLTVAEYLGERGIDIECREVKLYVVSDDEYLEAETVFRSDEAKSKRSKGINGLRNQASLPVRKAFDGLRERLLALDVFTEVARKDCVSYKILTNARLHSFMSLFPKMDDAALYVYFYRNALDKLGRYDIFLSKAREYLSTQSEEMLTGKGDLRLRIELSYIDDVSRLVGDVLNEEDL